MLDLYKNIKDRRLQLGLTQSELAAKLGYSDKTIISKIENGMVDMTQSRIIKFAEALKTTPSHLMGWDIKQNLINDGFLLNDSGSCNKYLYNNNHKTNNCDHCDDSSTSSAGVSQNKDSFFSIMDNLRSMSDDQLADVLQYTEFILSRK